jgi:hypothetical protein
MKSKRKKTPSIFEKDKRRKHHHWQVIMYYADGGRFARVYTDRQRAERFAARQKRSPIVKAARVVRLD